MAKKHYWHNINIEQTADILGADIKNGLSKDEASQKQEEFGLNKLPEEKPLSRTRILFAQLQSPLAYILIIAGIITLILRDYTDSIVIFTAVFLNTVVGFFQENKASNALRALKQVLKIKAIVLREGEREEILQENLVPSDIVILKAGDKVPADGRIIESLNLKINEAPLTGEWLTTEKIIEVLDKKTPLADRDNMAYMGTTIEEGEGRMLVTETGRQTEIGSIASLVRETAEEKTPYQKKISRFSKIVGLIITIICLFIFIGGIMTGKEFVEMFTTAVAVAVAAIPEGLPVAMTVILALGMQRILKKKGLVRKLASAETLGSTSIIAADKTLTLTEGKMKAEEIKSQDKTMALTIAVLCNEAFIENPSQAQPRWRLRGRPTDKALVLAGQEAGLIKQELEKELMTINEVPFNVQNKFIATLHQTEKGNKLLFVSGAPERILELSTKHKKKRGEAKINQSQAKKDLETMTSVGLRVIAVAFKRMKDNDLKIKNSGRDIDGLTFVGFIGLKDPLRKEAKQVIRICKKAGMRPVIVTGDHVLTSQSIARELGLPAKKENVMEGKDLEEMSEEKLGKLLDKISVFARVEPKHKMRIIAAFQKKNQVVAMTGDGINDAPALKKADIGVSLGSSTAVAKEVADLVLLNDNFSIIVAAIEEGRAILDNIRKVITYLLSDSFAEVILIGAALLFRQPLPILAVQILWVNIIEDGPLGLALAFEPKEKDLMEQKPQNHNIHLLNREMKVLIFIIGIITNILLFVLFLGLRKYSHYDISHIRSIIFAGLTIDSIFYIFSCKSLRRNIWKINPFSNKFLIIAWFFGVIMLVSAFYLPPLQTLLKTVPLNLSDWLLVLGLGIVNLMAIEATKYWFIARHQTN